MSYIENSQAEKAIFTRPDVLGTRGTNVEFREKFNLEDLSFLISSCILAPEEKRACTSALEAMRRGVARFRQAVGEDIQ